MNTYNPLTYIAIVLLLLGGCVKPNKKASSIIGLKDHYKQAFYIGVALDSNQIRETDSLVTKVITKEFNSITPENIMKSMFIHPKKDTFNFSISDKFIAFGKKYGNHIHGHTLVWHSQLSPWFKKIEDSAEMTAALTNHIHTIVGRYKGMINSWDVVNEALNEDGTLRKTHFLDALGTDYLASAFKWAAEADPEAELFYNDYNMTKPEKRAGAIKLVKELQAKGIKIDGVGMQGHWSLESPSLELIEESILDYASLGVKVAITELDINVLQNHWDVVGADVNQNFEGDESMNPYTNGLPEAIKIKLAKRYSDIFKLFLKHKDKISRVTFWGVHDGHSWLNNWPIKGRTNYPLLIDRALKPKQAYDSVMALK